MVCLTSCVFRSIRFSGFARPHRLGCGARENYTRRRRAGASVDRRVHRMDTSRGTIVVWRAFPAEEGRAWAAIPTARANRPGFGALGRAGARRPGGRRPRNGRPRPPAASGVAAALAHQGRTLPYAAPLHESANSRPAPQTTGLSRPGRPGLSVGQGTGTRAAPLGAQSRSLPPNVLRVWRYAHSNPFENWRQARLAP